MTELSEFDWPLIKQEYAGVPLKHFVDNYTRYSRVVHDKECPVPFHEPFFVELLGERTGNILHSFEPEQSPAHPAAWDNWHEQLTTDKLKKMPMKTQTKIDTTFVVANPAAF